MTFDVEELAAKSAHDPTGLGGRWIHSTWPASDPAELGRSYASIIAAHAARDPDHPAFLVDGCAVTYGEFLTRIGVLTARLRGQDAPPGPAALLAPLGADYFAGLLAGLEAGRPVVILEPGQPAPRQAAILHTAGAALVLHDGRVTVDSQVLANRTGLRLSDTSTPHAPPGLGPGLGADEPALLFTTSGSTGAPKLVAHSQRSLRTKLWALSQRERTAPSDRFMALGSHANFGSMLCLLTNLLSGATICVVDLQTDGLAAAFARMRGLQVNSLWMVPSVFRMIARRSGAAEALAHTRLLKLGGEPCTLADLRLARDITPSRCVLLNSYGTTEGGAFTWSTTADDLPDDPVIPVGTVDPGYAYALLDEKGEPVAEDAAGEITVTSSGVALGYWTRGTLDAARFPLDPDDPDRRVYRLGDLGRRRRDGHLVMLGRKDRILKINGQSVSPVEIEAELNAMPGCAASAVLAFGPPGGQRLAAFLVAEPTAAPEADPAAWLAERLPPAMIPARFERLDALPLLPGGKVDSAQLRARIEAVAAPASAAASDDPLVAELSAVWAEILRLEAPPTDVDFVRLGGDSLALIGLILEIETRFQRQLTIDHLDGAFTIERLAQLLRQDRFEPAAEASLFPIQPRGDRAPFYCVHALGRSTNYMVPLAANMGLDRPVFGLRPPADLELNHDLAALAQLYVDALTERQPTGPFLLGGFSLGGTIAHEMACRLQDLGREVALVVMIDTRCPFWRPTVGQALPILWRSLANLPGLLGTTARLAGPDRIRHTLRRIGRRILGRRREADDVLDVQSYPSEQMPFVLAHMAAEIAFAGKPRRLPMAVVMARVQRPGDLSPDISRGWSRFADVRRVAQVPGTHREIVSRANMPRLAAEVAAALDATGL